MNQPVSAAQFHPEAKKILDRALALHKATNVDELLGQMAEEITAFFGAQCVRLFAYDAVDNEVYTRVKLSDTLVELKFSVSEASVAGWTALHRLVVVLDDVRDPDALARYQGMVYDPRYEDRTGVQVTSILSAPMIDEDRALIGIIQLVNTRRPVHEHLADVDFLVTLGKVVAAAIFHHDARQRRATKFELLLEEALISHEELSQAIRSARQHSDDPLKGDPVSVLLEDFGVSEEAMRASLSRYYLTDFLPFDESRVIPPPLMQGFNLTYFRST